LAAKSMIQEWQDDGESYEEKHKKEIIELSSDAIVVSKYTAYIVVDVLQNKPVSGSMQGYELTAATTGGLPISFTGQLVLFTSQLATMVARFHCEQYKCN